jgi:phosphatidylserine/phosphatidylglycerophosphate/cardiolipin synthase-like enzyme
VSRTYVRAVAQLNWLLEPLEESLKKVRDHATINIDYVRLLVLSRQPSDDEILAALEALSSLGVLQHCRSVWQLNRVSLNETDGYRRGVRDAVELLPQRVQNTVTVCATLPTGLPHAVEQTLRSIAVDLRSALLDIVVTAKERIILASPFWDTETATELSNFLVRRIAVGVCVDLLGRFTGPHDTGWITLYTALSRYESCRFFVWYQPTGSNLFGTQTFHFKTAIADDGLKAYLGSANLTTAGLRSRMELGVILTGEPAVQVAQIVGVILAQASCYTHRPASESNSQFEPM